MKHTAVLRTAFVAGTTLLLALSGCGAGTDEEVVNSNISSAGGKCTAGSFPDTVGYDRLLAKYKNDQCLFQIQATEAYRQSAIANCAAGSTVGATGNYEYYLKSVAYNKSIGCN